MKSKILIIDDEENIRFGFEMILSDQGYDVMTAKDYDSALKTISGIEPDLIITDIILGRLTGMDLLVEVKKRKLLCPVIMITGEPNLETSTDAVRLGAFDYIPKPIRKETLLRIAGMGLQHKKLLDNKRQLKLENIRVRRNMEAIFRSLKDGVITVNNDLQVIEANESVKKICRFSIKEIVGKNFEKIQTDCSRSCLPVLKETLRTKKSIGEFRVECRHPDQPRQVVLLTSSSLRSHATQSLGAVLVVRDITRLTTLELELKERNQFHGIIGKSSKMQNIYNLLENLADTDTTVLITGETGTGKELVAHAIHYNSPRKENPFIKVNCSVLSENLLESELFGHVKGAFTGAVKNRKGRFEMADHGTIFLDEIGDISPLIQLKLLRVLQEREFERVGDSIPIKIDVRIIAATNCNLKEKIKLGEIREDLYYRIKVVDIPIPSLKERREDILLLSDYFLDRFNKRFKKQLSGLSNEVVNAFMNYAWPGNIRELEHAIEHGFVLCQGKTMRFDHLPLEIKTCLRTEKPGRLGQVAVNKEDLIQALKKTGWNKSKAARILGVGRRTIYRKIEQYKISMP
ncbi:sigma-54 dependent transcriptional regulator [Desulfobacula toluolica]|uniref:Two component system response regulator, sigma54-specific, PAS domain n=1 Tax=Desulfobacula toluolica (strain DSM 7467 / Tol2) TaxID=651182 RepID=K0NEA8_DESTT|nr:sigma-54-dependent Fis family transcriptional regulator [Desulfobacula toluolica]CCK79351.1 two component system response regulator, sigma54-specific, PAS domain [Desulfobacula toluolica Tol2]